MSSYAAEPGWLKRGTTKEKIISIVAMIIGVVSLVLTVGVCWILKQHAPVLDSSEGRISCSLLDFKAACTWSLLDFKAACTSFSGLSKLLFFWVL